MLESIIREELTGLEASGLKRTLKLVSGPQGPRVTVEGGHALLFCSNDYLGLANHPALKEAAIRAIEKYGFGAGASRLVSGNMEPHEALERAIASFKGTEAACLFNSGYNANLGVICALADRGTEIYSDKLNHASIIDACALSRANVRRYRDVESLERMLKASPARRKIIVTDGVFSMDGSIAPLPSIVPLLEMFGAVLIVDDAHATGVLGPNGRGTLEHFGITHPSVIQMGTLGKALGSFGAYIAGSNSLIELLRSKARSLIYTTALPPGVSAASLAAIDIVIKNPELRHKLWENVSYVKKGLSDAGLDFMASPTQIMPIVVGEAKRTVQASKRLLERGVFIQAIRPPTVPDGTSRLRLTVTAAHMKDDMDTALKAITEVLQGE